MEMKRGKKEGEKKCFDITLHLTCKKKRYKSILPTGVSKLTGVWEKKGAREGEREGESWELISWLCLPTAEKSPWEGYRTGAWC